MFRMSKNHTVTERLFLPISTKNQSEVLSYCVSRNKVIIWKDHVSSSLVTTQKKKHNYFIFIVYTLFFPYHNLVTYNIVAIVVTAFGEP